MAEEKDKSVKTEDLLKAYSEIMSKGYPKKGYILISPEWYKRLCIEAETQELREKVVEALSELPDYLNDYKEEVEHLLDPMTADDLLALLVLIQKYKERPMKRGRFSLTVEFLEKMFELGHGEIYNIRYNPDSRTLDFFHTNDELGFNVAEGEVVPCNSLPSHVADRLIDKKPDKAELFYALRNVLEPFHGEELTDSAIASIQISIEEVLNNAHRAGLIHNVEKHNANPHNIKIPDSIKKVFRQDHDWEATAYRNGEQIGKIEGLRYQAYRDMAPIYTMESPKPTSFARGKTSIAGSLILNEVNAAFAFTDKFDLEITSAGPDECGKGVMVIEGVELMHKGYTPEQEDIQPGMFFTFIASGILPWKKKEEKPNVFRKARNSSSGVNIDAWTLDGKHIGEIQSLAHEFEKEMAPIYTTPSGAEVWGKKARTLSGDLVFKKLNRDVPEEFHITLEAANEYGKLARMDLHKVRLNETDIKLEQSYRFEAEWMHTWHAVDKPLSIEEEENHEGQIYNPFTKKWSWL